MNPAALSNLQLVLEYRNALSARNADEASAALQTELVRRLDERDELRAELEAEIHRPQFLNE